MFHQTVLILLYGFFEINMNTGIGLDYDFNSEENASKWKGLLTTALKRVSILIQSYTHTHTHTLKVSTVFSKLSRGL